jgi:flagellar protein FliO/FliZ
MMSCVAWGANPSAAQAAMPAAVGTGNIVQMLGGLLVVLALIFALAWLARRVGAVGSRGGAVVNVLGGAALTSRERVVLLQVGETQLLVGVAPGSVRTLHVFAPHAVAAGAVVQQPPAGFAETLQSALHPPGASGGA